MINWQMVGWAVAIVFNSVSAEEGPTWRVRTDTSAPLNSDSGWAEKFNGTTFVNADEPFRIRFEWERTQSDFTNMSGIILQYRRNDDEDWIEVGSYDFPYPKGEEPRSPRVSAVHTTAYTHGEPTSDILRGSQQPFAGGTGVNLAAAASAWSERDGHMEIEWPLVIRRWIDGAEYNEDGDLFELQLADGSGHALPGASIASLSLRIAPNHVGGTFVETPGRIGPWQASNGDLYFIMEPAESSNLFMMMKSSDGGLSWKEVDGVNRPKTGDLESVDGRIQKDTIEIIHQVTERVYRHAFNTSDHPTKPDSWAATDEVVASKRSMAQASTLVVRSDGSMVTFYVGESLRYSIRSATGDWGPSQLVDTNGRPFFAGPQAVLGANDTVHLAYYSGDGSIWYRRMDIEGELSSPIRLADGVGTNRDAFGSVLPLVYLPDSDTVVVVFQLDDLRLWERRISTNLELSPLIAVTDRAVVREAADSQQPGADVIRLGNALQVLFIDNDNREIYTVDDLNGWGSPELQVDNVQADWVRGMAYSNSGNKYILHYIYDAGSGGGAGMNRYNQLLIDLDTVVSAD